MAVKLGKLQSHSKALNPSIQIPDHAPASVINLVHQYVLKSFKQVTAVALCLDTATKTAL